MNEISFRPLPVLIIITRQCATRPHLSAQPSLVVCLANISQANALDRIIRLGFSSGGYILGWIHFERIDKDKGGMQIIKMEI